MLDEYNAFLEEDRGIQVYFEEQVGEGYNIMYKQPACEEVERDLYYNARFELDDDGKRIAVMHPGAYTPRLVQLLDSLITLGQAPICEHRPSHTEPALHHTSLAMSNFIQAAAKNNLIINRVTSVERGYLVQIKDESHETVEIFIQVKLDIISRNLFDKANQFFCYLYPGWATRRSYKPFRKVTIYDIPTETLKAIAQAFELKTQDQCHTQ